MLFHFSRWHPLSHSDWYSIGTQCPESVKKPSGSKHCLCGALHHISGSPVSEGCSPCQRQTAADSSRNSDTLSASPSAVPGCKHAQRHLERPADELIFPHQGQPVQTVHNLTVTLTERLLQTVMLTAFPIVLTSNRMPVLLWNTHAIITILASLSRQSPPSTHRILGTQSRPRVPIPSSYRFQGLPWLFCCRVQSCILNLVVCF